MKDEDGEGKDEGGSCYVASYFAERQRMRDEDGGRRQRHSG